MRFGFRPSYLRTAACSISEATGFKQPRVVVSAPNGDRFVAESAAGLHLLRNADADGKPERSTVFASGLSQPFGIAFYPPGPLPDQLYVANTDSVVQFAYNAGNTRAQGKSETVVADIPGGGRLARGGHWTCDIIFSQDGKRMFASVGSKFNNSDCAEEKWRASKQSHPPPTTPVIVHPLKSAG